MRNNLKHIYGPVPSRRFKKSLGIDLVPYKVCSYDCIYCQLGRTTNKTILRKPYIDAGTLLEEFKTVLNDNLEADHITLAGSGEPTLNSGIGKIIEGIKKDTDIPVVVLTNGSLLWDKNVRREIILADIVAPSLDAVSANMFKKINRPENSLSTRIVPDGLKQFSTEYTGKIFLEIMFIKETNDKQEEIELFRRTIDTIKIDRIDLNTVVRPPVEMNVNALSTEELQEIKRKFDDDIPVEIIADFSIKNKTFSKTMLESDILNLLKRRPCKLDEMAVSLAINKNELLKYLTHLQNNKVIGFFDGFYKLTSALN